MATSATSYKSYAVAIHLTRAAWAAALGVALAALWGTVALVEHARGAAVADTFCFSGYYTAARLAVRGGAVGNLQDWDWFREQTKRYGFKATDIFAGNPPSAALPLAPLAFLEPRPARAIWVWFSVSTWVAGVVVFGSLMVLGEGGSLASAVPVLLGLAAFFEPFRSNLDVAHIYALAFLLQTAACLFWLRGRPSAGGAFAGVLLAFKGYGVPLILLAILRRDWRFLRAASAAFTFLAALAGVLLGFRQWPYFFETYMGGNSLTGTPTPALQTLKSFLGLALHLPLVQNGPLKSITPGADLLLFVCQSLVLAGALLWLSGFRVSAWRAHQAAQPSAPVLAASVLLNLVFSPRAEDHAYPLAMTAILLSIPMFRGIRATTVAATVGVLLLSWPFHLQDRMVVSDWNLVTDYTRLWGAVILLGAAILGEAQRRRGTQPPGTMWTGAIAACTVGIALLVWHQKPWRDPIAHGPLLAISRTAGNQVTLLRLDMDEREVATVPVSCKGPFGLAFAPARDRLYSTCWDNSKISLIDLADRRESRAFAGISRLPAWVQQRAGTGEIWVSNEDAGSVTIYNARTAAAVAGIPTGTGPSDIAFTAHGTRAWVTNEGAGTVSLIDAQLRRKLTDVTVGLVPQGMALTRSQDRLLVANFRSNTVSILDTASARQLVQIPVCEGPVDVVLAGRGNRELGYVSCFTAGSVAVVDIATHREIQRIAVGEKPFGIAAHPDGGRVYVCVGGANRLVVLETGEPSRILRRIRMDGNPLQAAIAN